MNPCSSAAAYLVKVGRFKDTLTTSFRLTKFNSPTSSYGYILLSIGVAFLTIGFRDKFSIEEDQNIRPAQYKKCTPFREGFGTCRTFDRKTVWVIRKESDGSEISRIEFPDSLNVISIGIFREGQAEVVGESRRRKYTVGYLTTNGDFLSKE